MRRFSICISLFLLTCLTLSATAHADGRAYLYDVDGKIVRDKNGECMRTTSWTPDARMECNPEILVRPDLIFFPWRSTYKGPTPLQGVPSVKGAPGPVDRVLETIETRIPLREELDPSHAKDAASQAALPAKMPEAVPATQPGAEAVTSGTAGVTTETGAVTTQGRAAAVPPTATEEATTPEWMKQAAKQKTPPKAKSRWTAPVQVILILILDAVAIATKFAHVW